MDVSLKNINSPADLRRLDVKDLPIIAQEIRDLIISTVACHGGHLGPPLGVVELTLALHYVFQTPEDKLMWDVGHQAYAHKIITGRRDRFSTLKQWGGISGYPNIEESEYDLFTVGHSSTSISQALGLATVRDMQGRHEKVIAVVGDGALTAGMAYEAINNAGHMKKNLLVVLNDNEMSISKNVGAISEYLNRIITAPIYNKARVEVRDLLRKLPESIGEKAIHTIGKIEESLKGLVAPGMLFEELGFLYVGPIDGHNLPTMIQTLESVKKMNGPVLLHVLTKKGKGYRPAEDKPDIYHGTAAFDIETGTAVKKSSATPFTKVFADTMLALAEKHPNLVGLTAAMPSGVGLTAFAAKFPQRFFDVGIAEQHCVTFAGALAKGGQKPVAAIYATFLQRALDQVIHDVCLQHAGVIFCLDRMGIVGEDGATHNGVFTIPILRGIPQLAIMLPKDGKELAEMLALAVQSAAPMAICYPKDNVYDELFASVPRAPMVLGQAEVLKSGERVAILAFGCMVVEAWRAAERLEQEGLAVTLVNMRFVKPMDKELLKHIALTHKYFIVVEEGALCGGAGSAVMEALEEQRVYDVRVKRMGIQDTFIEHGARSILLQHLGLTAEHIEQEVRAAWKSSDCKVNGVITKAISF